jgi:hypothetical protein
MTGDKKIADRQWDFERCPCVGRDYFYKRHHSAEAHAKKHKEMDANIQALARFSSSIRTMTKANAAVTIREAIGEDSVFQC